MSIFIIIPKRMNMVASKQDWKWVERVKKWSWLGNFVQLKWGLPVNIVLCGLTSSTRRSTQGFLKVSPGVGWEGKGDGHSWKLSPAECQKVATLYYILWRNKLEKEMFLLRRPMSKNTCLPPGQWSFIVCAAWVLVLVWF